MKRWEFRESAFGFPEGCFPPLAGRTLFMTQIVLYRSQRGIVLATDSYAVTYPSQGNPQSITVQKLFRLAPHVVMVTGGAGYGIPLCRRFQSYVGKKGLFDTEEILYHALPFFRAEMQEFRNKEGFIPPQCDLDRFYLLIAGYGLRSSDNPFKFLLLGSEHTTDPLHVIDTGHVVAIPRQMSIEYRLSHLSSSEADMEEVEAICEKFLVQMSEKTSDVGPPFHFARITADGVKIQTRETTLSIS